MASVAEARIRPEELSFRVLQTDPLRAAPERAAWAVRQFLARKRAGLARAVEVSAGPHEVILRAEGEAPEQVIREARELLGLGEDLAPAGEIQVDAADLAIQVVAQPSPEPQFEHEMLYSRVRCFPYPECEWFSISTGLLTLTDARVLYEPEWVIMSEHAQDEGQNTVIPLSDVQDAFRGEWWDIPCLMIQTPRVTYRYGWPAERRDLETIFDVDEWVTSLRELLGGGG